MREKDRDREKWVEDGERGRENEGEEEGEGEAEGKDEEDLFGAFYTEAGRGRAWDIRTTCYCGSHLPLSDLWLVTTISDALIAEAEKHEIVSGFLSYLLSLIWRVHPPAPGSQDALHH